MSTIVLTGGGTAGHCIPHLALLPQLNEMFDNICYIGSKNGIEKRLTQEKCDYFAIPTVKFRRSFSLKNLLIPFTLIDAVKKAKDVLSRLKPNVVFSKGGYVSLPVVIAASKLKIPIISHESDYTLGLANRLTAKKCDKVLTTFFDTATTLQNGKFCGSPVREGLFYADKRLALKKFGFDDKKPVVLIFGGSSGSKNINLNVNSAINKLLEKYYVLHICGRGNKYIYNTLKGYYLTEYLDDMASAYAVCSVAVSRGGSNALCELMSLKIPSLIIPLSKKGSRGDQIQNANYFANKGMCLSISDDNLSVATLINGINKVYSNREKIINAINRAPSIIGNRKIISELEKYK